MAFEYKGEFQVERGFGLPRMTSTELASYTPPEEGYQVFDTTLGRISTYVDGAWQLAAPAFDLLDKADTQDGVVKNSFTLQDENEQNVLAFNVQGGLANIDPVLYYIGGADISSGFWELAESSRFLRYLPENFDRNNGDDFFVNTFANPLVQMTSGKWYWETVATLTSGIFGGDQRAFYAGIINLNNFGESAAVYSGSSANVAVIVGNHSKTDASSTGGIRVPNAVLRHTLDFDEGTYKIAVEDDTFRIISQDSAKITGNTLVPYVGIQNEMEIRLFIHENEMSYPAPSGFSYLGSSASVPQFGELTSSKSQLDLSLSSGTAFSLKETHMESSAPIYGVDSTESNSLVTRASVARFVDEFVVGDWVDNAGTKELTFDTVAHGLTVDVSETYEVKVYELKSGKYVPVDIETEIDDDDGTVVVKTTGTAFAGRIRISR